MEVEEDVSGVPGSIIWMRLGMLVLVLVGADMNDVGLFGYDIDREDIYDIDDSQSTCALHNYSDLASIRAERIHFCRFAPPNISVSDCCCSSLSRAS